MPFAIQPGQTVLFIGDSITDCGRRAEHRPLGAGYVRMAVDLINARYPDNGCAFVNTGIGGNIIRDLFDRWTDDCIACAPDWLSVMIGINDLNRWLSGPEDLYGPDGYSDYYEKILTRARQESDPELILMTPFYMSKARPGEESWRGRVMEALPAYIEVVERMAERFDARLVRSHRMFQEQLEYRHPCAFGDEPVHPNATGHLLLAHVWLGAVGW